MLLLLGIGSVLLLTGCMNRFTPAAGWSGAAYEGGLIYLGSMEGQLLALDAETGILHDAFPSDQADALDTFEAIYGTPTVANGRVYVGGLNGKVYTLNSDTLEPEALTFEVEGAEQSKGIVGAVVVSDGMVVVGAAEDSQSGRIFVLDADTLQEVCRFPASSEETIGRVWSTPVVADGVAYVGDLDHHLYAISTDDCSPQWSAPADLGGGIGSTPLLLGDKLYVGSFNRTFYAVDIATGQAEAVFKAGGWFWSGIATDGQRLFTPNLDGKLYAVDIASGGIAWEFDTNGKALSAPVVVGSQVVVASDADSIHVLDAATGQKAWSFQVDADVRAPLEAQGSVVYVSTLDHQVHALDVVSRRAVWRGPYETRDAQGRDN